MQSKYLPVYTHSLSDFLKFLLGIKYNIFNGVVRKMVGQRTQ